MKFEKLKNAHVKNIQYWCNFLGKGTVSLTQLSKQLPIRPFPLATSHLDEATYRIRATLLQAHRYEVLNNTAKVWVKSVVVMANIAAKGWRMQYFLLAPIY